MSKPTSKAESRWLRFRKELRILCHHASELKWIKRQINRSRRIAEKEQIRDELR
jgi:hypothetical protein